MMMKKLILFLFSLFWGTCIMAQTLEPTVVAAAGDQFDNDQIGTLDWTLGEMMVEQYQSGDYLLEQGFHHMDDIMIVSLEPVSSGYELRLFPNPTVDWLNIEAANTLALEVILYNVNGKAIQEHQFSNNIRLDLSNLPAGLYVLRISDGVATTKSYRVVKIDNY